MQLLRLKEVQRRTTLPATEIYALMKTDAFPKQIPIGTRRVAWDADDIDAWIVERERECGHVSWGEREAVGVGA